MNSALCQDISAFISLSLSLYFGALVNWATQIAARVVKSAASVICWEVPLVDHPPHWKPMVIAMTAPIIRPQTPYLTLSAVSGFIDNAALKCGGIPASGTSGV